MIAEGARRRPRGSPTASDWALGRQPTTAELATLVDGFEADFSRFTAEPTAAEQYLAVGLVKHPDDVPVAEYAAYSLAANVIINLDEFVMRE